MAQVIVLEGHETKFYFEAIPNLPELGASPQKEKYWEPEKRVLARVIAQAIDDALAPRDCAIWEIQSAHDFFYDGRMEIFCHHIGWRPNVVRDFYEKARVRVRNGEKWKRLSTIDSVQTPLVPTDLRTDEDDWDEEERREESADELLGYLWGDSTPGGTADFGVLHQDLCSAQAQPVTD